MSHWDWECRHTGLNIYLLDNIFTFYETKLHKQNTFTKDKKKKVYKMPITFTNAKINLQVAEHFYSPATNLPTTESHKKENMPDTGSDWVSGQLACFGAKTVLLNWIEFRIKTENQQLKQSAIAGVH